MGTYLNPGNAGFKAIVASDYVDKTGLAELVNGTIGTTRNLTCVSRPRRFGKSYAAQMLCAYYDKTCDSHALFEGLAISRSPSYKEHLNQYDVIYLDMAGIKPNTNGFENLPAFVIRALYAEIGTTYPEVGVSDDLPSTLANLVTHTGRKVVALIDEWDAPVRENPEYQQEYLEFLRSLFKNSGITSKVFAAAYMTGILPIRKDGSQSAMSDFREYSMLRPWKFAEYVGFVDHEVRDLCRLNQTSYEDMRRWYDGYSFKGVGPIYNPNSVMRAVEYGEFDSYWTQSSATRSLIDYISRDYKGLTRTVAELVGGLEVEVDTKGFSNDLTAFNGTDDVLTLLVHMGYLAYDAATGRVRIPNEEVRQEFQRSLRETLHAETRRRLEESERLFFRTIEGNEEAVARQIEKVHAEETSPLHYNNESSLRAVIKLAYYTYRDNYLQWEELPAGIGYADLVYLPKKNSGWPALVVELKWNGSSEGAIAQIKKKGYADALEGYGGEVLLVGISYDTGTKHHTCRIERMA